MADKVKIKGAKAGKRQDKKASAKKSLRTLCIMLIVLVFGVIGIYGYAMYGYPLIYPNVFIGAASVSGLSQQQAQQEVQGSISDEYQGALLEVEIGDTVIPISSADLHIDVSPESTAKAAYEYGRTGNIFQRVYDITSAFVLWL